MKPIDPISFSPTEQPVVLFAESPTPPTPLQSLTPDILATPFGEQLKTLTDILTSAGKSANSLSQFIGDSPVVHKIKQQTSLLAHTDDAVLITGPTGHGKELIARALHKNPCAPFVAVNCAALPETLISSLLFGHVRGTFTGATDDRAGYFEAAGNGTVFLDEIGDMPESLQPYLLRTLQERTIIRLGEHRERPIQCRIIAATNRTADLRNDLLGRLMTFTIHIPPLSERKADIILIAQHYGLPIDVATQLSTITHHLDQINKFGVRYIQSCARRWQVFQSI